MPEEMSKPKEIEPAKEKNDEVHTYVVVDDKGEESGGFKGKYPRQAALKVANTQGGTKGKPVTFKIRERGTKKLHIFSGYTEVVKTPEKRPKWMKETVRKPFVRKVGVEKIEKEPK